MMKSEKTKFTKKFKKELSKKLYEMAEQNEKFIRKMLEQAGVDSSGIRIIDRAKFVVKYMPDVMEELSKKYGTSRVLMDDPKIKKEALNLIQKRFHEDLAKQKVESWNIYYILLYCDIQKPMRLGENVRLIPFNRWPCNDYLEILHRLMNNLGPPASQLSEKNIEKGKEHFIKNYSERNPVGLLIFQDVKARNESEVYEKTRDYAEDVILCISNLTNSSIELRGWLIESKLGGISLLRPNIFFPIYKPTYMKPESMEKAAKRILKYISENSLLRSALKYEQEALSEDEEKFRILKRWSALEFIAEEYARRKEENERILSKSDIREITSTIRNILEEKNYEITSRLEDKIRTHIGQINHKNAKEKVRDLLDWANCQIGRLEKTEKDTIDVIYQHRNCIIHLGGCYKSDKTVKEDCGGPAYCRESEFELVELNGELSRMLTRVIGKFVGIEFEFKAEIPKHLQRK